MAQVQVRQQFQAGEKVSLHRRVGDWYSTQGAGDAVTTVEADDEGVVTFPKLADGDPFWAVGEGGRQLKVTAKDPPAAKTASSVPPELAGQTRSQSARTVTTGARDSRSAQPDTKAESPKEAPKKTKAGGK